MSPRKAILRLVVCRKPVPFLLHPDREDAKDFLGAYVCEFLECGHRIDVYFNPPMEPLIAKRRRCGECDEAEKVIPITAGKKAPRSVEVPAEKKRALG